MPNSECDGLPSKKEFKKVLKSLRSVARRPSTRWTTESTIKMGTATLRQVAQICVTKFPLQYRTVSLFGQRRRYYRPLTLHRSTQRLSKRLYSGDDIVGAVLCQLGYSSQETLWEAIGALVDVCLDSDLVVENLAAIILPFFSTQFELLISKR